MTGLLSDSLRNSFRFFTPVWLLLLPCTGLSADYTVEVLNDELSNPWCVAELPDGSLLITERGGQLQRLEGDGSLTQVSGVPPVLFRGQGGLFDVLPDPGFAANQIVYLSYAHGELDANATRIARARLREDTLTDLEVLFTAQPDKDTPQHYGGRLALLPDGTLLLTTGDGFDYREQAQNIEVTLGKTVRINTDGSIPADNPFAGGPGHDAVWTYGHRNPQGLAVDTATGTVYQHEHGPKGGDEINRLTPGSNYGWPAVTYGDDYSGATISPFTELPGMTPPLLVWVPSIAPSGLAVYRGSQFPDLNGQLLVGALVDREVRAVDLQTDPPEETRLFPEISERVRDIRIAADGAILVLTDGDPGTLYRISATRI